MGGFTRPQDLRITNWFPGGPYLAKNKVYESPPEAAYEPHTVFLLEARYVTKHGHGRADSIEHIVGVCREGDLPAIIEHYNSPSCPQNAKEIMDNARWPWMKQKEVKRTVWWEKGEDKAMVMRQRERDIYYGPEITPSDAVATSPGLSAIPIDLVSASSSSSVPTMQRRAFHRSSRVSSDSSDKTKTTPEERAAEIPTSSWARPPKPPQDANDDVVPTYYIERKRQLDEIAERKEAEGNLMSQLSAGILSEGIAAQTRVREGKIPAEIIDEDGTVRHASGFEVPTPATEFHPVVAMPPLETDEPLVTDGKVSWEEALIPSESEEPSEPSEPSTPSATSPSQSSPNVRKFHTSAIAHAREVAMDWSQTRAEPPHQSEAKAAPSPQKKLAEEREEFEEDEDGFDEELIADLSDGVPSVTDTPAQFDEALLKHRQTYMTSLKDKPYWRPVLTATFSTRPLALTYARLSRALPRGTPFYSTIDNDDRKISVTYNSRMHALRWKRMRQLAIDMGRRLRGDFGGFPGIRFDVHERGRGINGEGLEAPIPDDKRIIQVGLGAWHQSSADYKELLQDELAENELSGGFHVFEIDERGRRLDGKVWREPVLPLPKKSMLGELLGKDADSLTSRQRDERLQGITKEHGRKVAYALAQRTSRISYPPRSKEATVRDYIDGKVPVPDTV
jgi:hypothetical protein